ncbi:MAG: hypothetical protein ABSH38_09925 [Verrucomicrobiota bacterium]
MRDPFLNRVLLLLGLMAVVAGVDFWRNRARGAKYREYAFVLIAGVAGALLGWANDLITSSISPDYFTLGKGLAEGGDLRWRAGVFGLKEGFSAGIIGGAVCLFACAGKSPMSPAQARRLLGALWMPLTGAVLMGVALPRIAGRFDPLGFSADLNSLLNADQLARFRQVWWTHTGLYAGTIIGLAAMILRRKQFSDDRASRDHSRPP